MKRNFVIATFLSFLLGFSTQASESYKAPRLKMKDAPGYKSVNAETTSDWDSSYRVEENVSAERALASDKAPEPAKKVERNPGSAETETFSPPARWRFDGK